MDKIGKYQVIGQLGKGATGAVYLAVDPFSGREVAIKLFFPEALRDRERGRIYRKLFLTEASLAGKLAHPHIVSIFDAVVEEDTSYIVMEYVAGTTLEARSEPENLLPVGRVVEISYKCCKALEYAQHMGIIHRDIKPANILLSGKSDIKVSDFGSAITAEGQQTTQVTAVGSPAFMSPQQIKEHPLNHQTDIYSLGVVMYKLLTGRLPFNANNNYSMIYQIINVNPGPPSTFRPEIPAALDHIVMRAMAKELEFRYPSWEEFARDLAGVAGLMQDAREVITDTEKFDTLRALSFFAHFSDVELWEVVRITRWQRHPAGAALITEGDTGRSFFILAAGEVKVSKQGRLLNVLKAGECFGEMSCLAQREFRRSASIIAAAEITVIEITAELLAHASENCRDRFNGAFLQILVERLALANTRLSGLLAEHNITII
ncbi:MAG: protein kinase [Betaproteobacteria bacterium]|nr:protein kinase [Betaproteobacteria bacterium]